MSKDARCEGECVESADGYHVWQTHAFWEPSERCGPMAVFYRICSQCGRVECAAVGHPWGEVILEAPNAEDS